MYTLYDILQGLLKCEICPEQYDLPSQTICHPDLLQSECPHDGMQVESNVSTVKVLTLTIRHPDLQQSDCSHKSLNVKCSPSWVQFAIDCTDYNSRNTNAVTGENAMLFRQNRLCHVLHAFLLTQTYLQESQCCHKYLNQCDVLFFSITSITQPDFALLYTCI